MRTSLFAALLAYLLPAFAATAQQPKRPAPTNLTKATTNPERKAILDALRATVSHDIRLPVRFIVTHIAWQGDWVFFRGNTRQPTGEEIAWEKHPDFRELCAAGVFDGDHTDALLHRVKGRWQTKVYVIGPTDLPWTCWWKQYGAPRAIFTVGTDDRCP